jgi:hypothetical protein
MATITPATESAKACLASWSVLATCRTEVGNVRGSAMDTDVARTWDWIGSVVLFAFAILIILAFGLL